MGSESDSLAAVCSDTPSDSLTHPLARECRKRSRLPHTLSLPPNSQPQPLHPPHADLQAVAGAGYCEHPYAADVLLGSHHDIMECRKDEPTAVVGLNDYGIVMPMINSGNRMSMTTSDGGLTPSGCAAVTVPAEQQLEVSPEEEEKARNHENGGSLSQTEYPEHSATGSASQEPESLAGSNWDTCCSMPAQLLPASHIMESLTASGIMMLQSHGAGGSESSLKRSISDGFALPATTTAAVAAATVAAVAAAAASGSPSCNQYHGNHREDRRTTSGGSDTGFFKPGLMMDNTWGNSPQAATITAPGSPPSCQSPSGSGSGSGSGCGNGNSALLRAPDLRYKGVRLRSWGAWVTEAREPLTKQRVWLGSYPTAEGAARVYDMALLLLQGAPASRLNFPLPEQHRPVIVQSAVATALLRAARAGWVARQGGSLEASQTASGAGDDGGGTFTSELVRMEIKDSSVMMTEWEDNKVPTLTPHAGVSKQEDELGIQVSLEKHHMDATGRRTKSTAVSRGGSLTGCVGMMPRHHSLPGSPTDSSKLKQPPSGPSSPRAHWQAAGLASTTETPLCLPRAAVSESSAAEVIGGELLQPQSQDEGTTAGTGAGGEASIGGRGEGMLRVKQRRLTRHSSEQLHMYPVAGSRHGSGPSGVSEPLSAFLPLAAMLPKSHSAAVSKLVAPATDHARAACGTTQPVIGLCHRDGGAAGESASSGSGSGSGSGPSRYAPWSTGEQTACVAKKDSEGPHGALVRAMSTGMQGSGIVHCGNVRSQLPPLSPFLVTSSSASAGAVVGVVPSTASLAQQNAVSQQHLPPACLRLPLAFGSCAPPRSLTRCTTNPLPPLTHAPPPPPLTSGNTAISWRSASCTSPLHQWTPAAGHADCSFPSNRTHGLPGSEVCTPSGADHVMQVDSHDPAGPATDCQWHHSQATPVQRSPLVALAGCTSILPTSGLPPSLRDCDTDSGRVASLNPCGTPSTAQLPPALRTPSTAVPGSGPLKLARAVTAPVGLLLPSSAPPVMPESLQALAAGGARDERVTTSSDAAQQAAGGSSSGFRVGGSSGSSKGVPGLALRLKKAVEAGGKRRRPTGSGIIRGSSCGSQTVISTPGEQLEAVTELTAGPVTEGYQGLPASVQHANGPGVWPSHREDEMVGANYHAPAPAPTLDQIQVDSGIHRHQQLQHSAANYHHLTDRNPSFSVGTGYVQVQPSNSEAKGLPITLPALAHSPCKGITSIDGAQGNMDVTRPQQPVQEEDGSSTSMFPETQGLILCAEADAAPTLCNLNSSKWVHRMNSSKKKTEEDSDMGTFPTTLPTPNLELSASFKRLLWDGV